MSSYRHRHSPGIHDSAQLQRYPNDQLELNTTSFPHVTQQEHPIETSEARSWDKLLGRDCNYYMEQHRDRYEAARKKWNECSMAEWKAGADGIYSRKFFIHFVEDLDRVVFEIIKMSGFCELISVISSSYL